MEGVRRRQAETRADDGYRAVSSAIRGVLARAANSRKGIWFERNIWRLGVCVWSSVLLVQAWRHRDEHWNWLFTTSAALAGLTVVALDFRWLRRRARGVRLFAGGLVALGLTLAGLPSSDPSLTVALFLALAGPATVILWAQSVTHRDEQFESLDRQQKALNVLEVQLRGLVHLMRIANAQERRHRSGHRPVAGHRRLERAERRLHAEVTLPD